MSLISEQNIYVDQQRFKLKFLTTYLDFFKKNEKEIAESIAQLYLYLSCSSNKSQAMVIDIKNSEFNICINNEASIIYLTSLRASQELLMREYSEDSELVKFINEIQAISQSSNFSWIDYATYDGELVDAKDFYPQGVKNREYEFKKSLINYLDLYKAPFMEKVSNFSLDLSSKYELIRIHVLKFLAVVPCLDHDKSGVLVKKSLLEMLSNLLEDQRKIKKGIYKNSKPLPWHYIFLSHSIRLLCFLLPANILTPLIKSSIKFMAKRFIAGENIFEAKQVLKMLRKTNRDATFDQLGELVLTKDEADYYLNRVLETISGFKDIYQKGERNGAGVLRAHVSIKVSALAHNLIPYDFEYSFTQIAPRLRKIFDLAISEKVFINIDAEHFEYRDSIWDIYKKVLMEDKYASWKDTGIVVQAYLKDGYKHLEEIIDFTQTRKLPMPIRLVKGAYWDAETVEAKAHSHIAPQFLNKAETDIHYRQLIFEILASDYLDLAIASHNIHDHAYAEALKENQFPQKNIEHQCLHMTFEALSFALSKMNWSTRNYVPIGDLLIGMSYLVRRVMENSSQTGFLFHSRKDNISLLDFSFESILSSKNQSLEDNLRFSSDFFSQPTIQLFRREHLKNFKDEVETLKKSLPLKFSEGQSIYSPNDSNLKIGEIKFYKPEDTEAIVKKSTEAFCHSEWRNNFSLRLESMINLSEKMRLKRDELSSFIMIESGKTVTEAYADVDEAIDFINFYLREYRNYDSEKNLAKGIGLIIAPWNFPLAIACGMSVVSLITGNATILKSSEKTPLIAEIFSNMLKESGVPDGIFQHIPGDGGIGEALSNHEDISFITFTGSKKVGLKLYEKSRSSYTHLINKKKYSRQVIAEMGGKNAIVVSSSCEMDETLSGVLYSAFAHAGQKCSACSRVFIHHSVYDIFQKRLSKAIENLSIGSSEILHTFVNPLISEEDIIRANKITHEIKKEISATDIVYEQKVNESGMFHPFVFSTSLETYLEKEIFTKEYFAPILHLIIYKDESDLLKGLNNTDYALTHGIYSQSYEEIEKNTSLINAGNIYVNRPNTGARVGIEPFGGYYLSGTGPKAGSREYLKSFFIRPLEEEKSIEDSGSDFSLGFLDEKHQSLEDRLSQTSNVLKRLGLNQSSFQKIFDICSKNQIDYNHIIPGQLSFNDFSKSKKHFLILSSYEKPNPETIKLVLAGHLLNSKVVILSTNEKNYEFWRSEFKFLASEILFASVGVLTSTLKKDEFKNIYLEGDRSFQEKIIPLIPIVKDKSMVKVYTSNQQLLYANTDFFDFFRFRRSFAINTMRHGAPLDLN